MKKLIYLLPLLLLGCSQMQYSYEYIEKDLSGNSEGIEIEATESSSVGVDLRVVDQLAPNVYVLECHFECSLRPINAISLAVDYNPDEVTLRDEVTINEKLYLNEYDDLNNLAGTFFFNTGESLRYSFATIQDVTFENEFIFRQIVQINSDTRISFSEVQGDVEFTDKNAKPYPVKCVDIQFKKI